MSQSVGAPTFSVVSNTRDRRRYRPLRLPISQTTVSTVRGSAMSTKHGQNGFGIEAARGRTGRADRAIRRGRRRQAQRPRLVAAMTLAKEAQGDPAGARSAVAFVAFIAVLSKGFDFAIADVPGL